MEGGARTRLAVVVVVVIAAVALVPLALGGGDDEAAKPAPGLRVERSGSAVELIVYVKPGDNVAATAGGARSVMLRCVDAAGRLVRAQEEAWPFGGSDPLAGGPHAHVPLDPATMNEVSSCRLVGTKPVLEGAVR